METFAEQNVPIVINHGHEERYLHFLGRTFDDNVEHMDENDATDGANNNYIDTRVFSDMKMRLFPYQKNRFNQLVAKLIYLIRWCNVGSGSDDR